MLSIIVAKAKNNTIGNNQKLLWKLPDDMKRFKKITTGHTVIMGRKTFESIGRVLPNRKNVIITNNPDFHVEDDNVEIVHSKVEIEKYVNDSNENFVIGGAMIYNLLMPYVTKMYITEIEKDFDGDTCFPHVDTDVWEEIENEKGPKDGINNFEYKYITYVRKK